LDGEVVGKWSEDGKKAWDCWDWEQVLTAKNPGSLDLGLQSRKERQFIQGPRAVRRVRPKTKQVLGKAKNWKGKDSKRREEKRRSNGER
jgi:hypothetical protein